MPADPSARRVAALAALATLARLVALSVLTVVILMLAAALLPGPVQAQTTGVQADGVDAAPGPGGA